MKPFGVYSRFPVEFVEGRDTYLWDREGGKYLDMYGGHAVISVGHSHPRYIDRIQSQLQQIGFYSNSVENSHQEMLAEQLGRLSGYTDHSLFLCNSGAEANENAFKLASFHTGRKKVIGFTGGFHGRTSAAVAVTDHPDIRAPLNETDNAVILPFNEIAPVRQAFQDNDIAAVIVEGIQGIAGVYPPDQDFLRTLRELCDHYSAILILDEVQSGYGRTGEFFAHKHFGITADIVTTGKGMGNGFPLAGVVISPEIRPFPGMLGSTFGGNHLACAAGNAVLEIMEDEDLVRRAGEIGNYLLENLKKLPGPVREVRGSGLMIGVELETDVKPVRKRLLEENRVLTGSSARPDTLRIMPSLTLKRPEADLFIQYFKNLIENLKLNVA